MIWANLSVNVLTEFQRNYNILFHLAWGYVKNNEDAADILQDVAANLMKCKPSFPNEKACCSYLNKAIRNAAINKCKSKQHCIPLESESLDRLQERNENYEDAFERSDTRLLLNSVLGGYSKEMQEAFKRYVFDEVPVRALAKELGIRYGSLRQQLSRMQKVMILRLQEVNDKDNLYVFRKNVQEQPVGIAYNRGEEEGQ